MLSMLEAFPTVAGREPPCLCPDIPGACDQYSVGSPRNLTPPAVKRHWKGTPMGEGRRQMSRMGYPLFAFVLMLFAHSETMKRIPKRGSFVQLGLSHTAMLPVSLDILL